jgi:integrase
MARQSGIRVRHSRSCASRHGGDCRPHATGCPSRNGSQCTCRDRDGRCWPAYEAHVWDLRRKVKIRRTFRNFDEAKSWRTDAAKAARDGRLTAPSKRTVSEAGEQLIAKVEAGAALTRNGSRYKPSVARTYKRNLRKYVFPTLGSVRLTSLRRRDVQEFVDGLVASGLTGSSVRNILAPLRVICRRAIEDDELAINPTAHLRLPEGPGRRERAAPVDEAMRLLSALPEEQRALWATAIFSGLRRGELRALRWSDIDDGISIIRVVRTWDDIVGEVEPKSKKSKRTVPVASVLRLFLLEHKASTGRRDNELVFGKTASDPFSPGMVNKRARGAWATRFACGCDLERDDDDNLIGQGGRRVCPQHRAQLLQPICLHECRHTYVSLMHDAGVSLERIGDYVGHNSAYMVDRYRHLLDGHEAEAARLFDEYLDRRTGGRGAFSNATAT